MLVFSTGIYVSVLSVYWQ